LRVGSGVVGRASVAIVALISLLIAGFGETFAQGLDLSQLLGGGSGQSPSQGLGLPQLLGGGASRQQRGSGNSNGNELTVQRGVSPFDGKFVGKQEDQGAETTMTVQFACYPANDSALPQTRVFACYGPTPKAKSPSGADTP